MDNFTLASAKYSTFIGERFADKLNTRLTEGDRISNQEARLLLKNAEELLRDLLPHVKTLTDAEDMNKLISSQQ